MTMTRGSHHLHFVLPERTLCDGPFTRRYEVADDFGQRELEPRALPARGDAMELLGEQPDAEQWRTVEQFPADPFDRSGPSMVPCGCR